MRRVSFVLAVIAALLGPAAPSGAAESGWVSVSEAGGIGDEAAGAVAAAAGATGASVAEFREGTTRLLRVTRGEDSVQEAPKGMAFPMSTAAIDPVAAAPLVGADVARVLAAGDLVFGEVSARLRGAEVGDRVEFIGWDGEVHAYRIGLIVPDERVRWAEMAVSLDEAERFGLDRVQTLVVHGFASRDQFEILLQRSLPETFIRVRGTGSPVSPDWTLPTALIKQRFGEFAYAPTGTDRIFIDQDWVERNIVLVDLPVVGSFRCHRLTVPQIEGALVELQARGLDHLVDRENFRIAGGCYNPRLTRGGDKGGRVSRHAWGAAFDFNTADNPYGGVVGMDRRVAEVFREWGFAWGGNWVFPDGGHFEWKHLPRGVDGPALVGGR